MIHNISSSSESGSNSYGYTDDLDDDYAMMDGASQDGDNDGYSYSTEIPDDDDDVVMLSEVKQKFDEELCKFLAKIPELPLPEKNTGEMDEGKMEMKNSPVDVVRGGSKVSSFWGKVWFLFNLLIRAIVIFVLCAHLHGMVNKNQDIEGLIVPKISVESVSVFPIDHDPISNNITANWNVIFNVENPSEDHELAYYHLTAEVLFEEDKNPVVLLFPVLNKFIQPWIPSAKSTIWKTDVPGFFHSEFEQQLVKVTFNPFPVSIDNATGAALVKDIKSGLSTGFFIRLNGNITEHNYHGMPRPASFMADCGLNMAFMETGGGVMAAPSEACKVTRGKPESWTMFAVYAGVVLHVAANTCSYLSSKYQSRRAKSAVSHAKEL